MFCKTRELDADIALQRSDSAHTPVVRLDCSDLRLLRADAARDTCRQRELACRGRRTARDSVLRSSVARAEPARSRRLERAQLRSVRRAHDGRWIELAQAALDGQRSSRRRRPRRPPAWRPPPPAAAAKRRLCLLHLLLCAADLVRRGWLNGSERTRQLDAGGLRLLQERRVRRRECRELPHLVRGPDLDARQLDQQARRCSLRGGADSATMRRRARRASVRPARAAA